MFLFFPFRWTTAPAVIFVTPATRSSMIQKDNRTESIENDDRTMKVGK